MSITLSLNPISHVFVDYPFARSNTLSTDTASNRTVQLLGCRTASAGSYSTGSLTTSGRPQASRENVPPLRTVQSTTYAKTTRPTLRKVISQLPPRGPWTEDLLPRLPSVERSTCPVSTSSFVDINLEDRVRTQSLFEGFDSIAELDVTEAASAASHSNADLPQPEVSTTTDDATPFKKWLATLRRSKGPQELTILPQRISLDDPRPATRKDLLANARPRASTAESSSRGFITAVRSATVTLADSSIAPRSWLGTLSKQLHRGKHSRSNTVDSIGSSIEHVDEIAMARAIRRRHILEELIETEESYIADLKVLANVYTTLLAASAMPSHVRTATQDNFTQLIHLHDTLLGDLYEVVPYSEYNHKHAKEVPDFHPKGHIRWHSADSFPGKDALSNRLKDSRLGRRFRCSLDNSRLTRDPGVATCSGPRIAVNVGRVFEKHMKQFLAYEEYAARYEMMAEHLGSTYKDLSTKETVERGVEILARTLESIGSRDEHSKKGLTFQDLLIKPIQRVCKYPLLFSDLLKHTPIGDDPEAHAELQGILDHIRTLAEDVNKATHDQRTKDLIEKTWLLQDRLNFGHQPGNFVLIRQLGHVSLCGVLHMAYQTKKEVKGQYMLCALFKSCLILATSDRGSPSYTVAACIPLAGIHLEEADNGRGLQCHTAPHSWKLIFEVDHRLYELMFSACSQKEEQQWKDCLNKRAPLDILDEATRIHRNISSELVHEIKPLTNVYGQGQPLSRRISIRRAATLGPKSQMCQVIIRNTTSSDQSSANSSTSSLTIGRSQSLLNPNHIPVLCPRRSERVHLEIAMTDLYTKDVLPFPGMKGSDNPFRASAHSVMRKLSMVSLTSTFSRRSASFASFHGSKGRQEQQAGVDAVGRPQRSRVPSNLRPTPSGKATIVESAASSVPPAVPPKPVVDFHKTPEAFLPPDFSLRDPRVSTVPRNSGLRAIASKQVLAENPDVPEYKKLKRSMSMQGEMLLEDGRLLAERPNLQTEKSELAMRESLDASRNLGFDGVVQHSVRGKESMSLSMIDRTVPLGASGTNSRPLTKRIRDLLG